MFCRSDSSSRRAKVPISASVAITPRTRSLPTASAMACPIGSSTMARHAAAASGSPPFQDVPAGLLAGAQRFDQRRPEPFGHQPAAPVERGEPALVAGRADGGERVGRRPTRSAGRCARRRRIGVYDENRRRANRTAAPRSSTMRDGSRLTRYEYRDTRTSTPSKACAETAAPPIVPQPLQQPHPEARAGQIAGRDQAVVAAADDDDIEIPRVVVGHTGCLASRCLAQVTLDLVRRDARLLRGGHHRFRAVPAAAAAGPSTGRVRSPPGAGADAPPTWLMSPCCSCARRAFSSATRSRMCARVSLSVGFLPLPIAPVCPT